LGFAAGHNLGREKPVNADLLPAFLALRAVISQAAVTRLASLKVVLRLTLEGLASGPDQSVSRGLLTAFQVLTKPGARRRQCRALAVALCVIDTQLSVAVPVTLTAGLPGNQAKKDYGEASSSYSPSSLRVIVGNGIVGVDCRKCLS